MNGRAGLFQDPVGHAAQISAGGIPQIRQRPVGGAGQMPHRLTIRANLHIRRNHFLPQDHHVVALGIDLQGLRGVVVSDQQITAAFDQAHGRVVHVQCNQAAFDRAKAFAQASHPGREKRERQRVGQGKLDEVLPGGIVTAQHGAGVLQGLEHLQRLRIQGVPRRGERGGVRAAVHQVHARPGFKRLDAPRERGLRHVSQLRRAAETAGFSQAHKVFQPFGFHAAIMERRKSLNQRTVARPTCWRNDLAVPTRRRGCHAR